jgi:hypothetical protein
MTDIPLAPVGAQAPEMDDGVRPNMGVVATLRLKDPQTACLAFDDVSSPPLLRDKTWNFDVLYTRITYPADLAMSMELTDDQYRDIGIALMARLTALAQSRQFTQGGDSDA